MKLILVFSLFIQLFSQSNYERTGDYLQIALPTVALLSNWKTDQKNDVINSILTTVSTTYLLKATINRRRPNGGQLSFPSGHTSAAFTGAYYINKRYGHRIGLIAYGAATYVGWSRVNAKKHYLTDVIAGAALAMTISNYFDSTSIFLTPRIGDNNQFEFEFSIRF